MDLWVSVRKGALGWILFLITVIILQFPIHMELVYHPVSSPYVFENLPLFFVLYSFWLVLLFVLLLLKREATYQILILCLFSLVFLGFWVVITPYGESPDGMWIMGHVKYVLNEGRIDLSHPNLGYFEFPAMPILMAYFSQITGFDVFSTRMIYLLSSPLIFTFTLFVAYRRVFGNDLIASLGTLMLIQSNIWISIVQSFTPANLSFLYFSSFLVLFFSRNLTFNRKLTFIILYGALVIAYVSLSFGFLFLLLALVLCFGLRKSSLIQEKLHARAVAYLLGSSFFLFIGWEIYQSVRTFSVTFQWFTKFLGNTLQDRFFLLFNVAKANLGEQVPTWANVTRIFWWIFIFGFGLVIALRYVYGFRRCDDTMKNLLVWLGAFLVYGLLIMLISPGGAQFHRLMLYAPFFIVPVILITLVKKRLSVYLVVALLIVLSFPTFLANNPRTTYLATYPTEVSAGAFLGASYNRGDNLQIISEGWAKSACYLDLYNAQISSETESAYASKKDFWERMDVLLANFEKEPTLENREAIFLFGKKSAIVPQHLLGISPNDPEWFNFTEKLLLNDQIYSNGNVVLFSRR